MDSIEIQTIMSLLKIIDNPMQDIPFVTVLRSIIGGFTDNELIEIRLSDKQDNFYKAMMKSKLSVRDELRNKIESFLEMLEKYRSIQEYLTLDELIWQIYMDTGFYNYVSVMPNGKQKVANLKLLFEKAKEYEKSSFKGLFNFILFIEKLKVSSGDMGQAKIISENENVVRIMSIHKSKGLEFPIVFLSATGRKFNLMDLNETIILDQDIGIGPKLIDYERRIEYNTLAKEAIKKKVKIETLSEEMRVLYVALTRAKEKLIITGVQNDIEKSLKDKEKLIEIYECEDRFLKGLNRNNKINKNIIKKFNSYLDWIELVYKYNIKKDIEKILNVYTYKKEDIIVKDSQINDEKNISKILETNDVSQKNQKELDELLNWKYENIFASKIEGKTSVTKMKKMENLREAKLEDEIENNIFENIQQKEVIVKAPKFLNDEIKISNAKKGTLMHLCLQKLNIAEEYTIEKIKIFIEKLVNEEIISKKEAECININKLYKITKSGLWKELKTAKKVYKERPFYINIPAEEVYNEITNEMILVQGIIDLEYIDKNGNIILVDYKTDYVEDEKDLIEKYRKQLQLYKRAIENAEKAKVKETYIYSIYLEKQILVENI